MLNMCNSMINFTVVCVFSVKAWFQTQQMTHVSWCRATWPADRSWTGPEGGSRTLFGWAALWPTRGSAPSVAPGLEAAGCRGPGTAGAPPRLRGRWWVEDRWGSGAGRDTWAGSDSGRTCAGSAGTGEEAGTGAGRAEAPAVGRMRGPLCLGDVGYTPGAVVRNDITLLLCHTVLE